MKVVKSLIILISLYLLPSEARLSDQNLNTVDISDVNKNPECRVVESIVDGIPTTIFFPVSGLINQVICEDQLIWLPEEADERVLYVAVYLKDGQPNIVQVVLSGQLVENLFFKQRGRGWIQSMSRFAEKMDDLELDIPLRSSFPMYINYRRPSYLCNVMNFTIYGEYASLFLPNPGYRATVVRERDLTLWTARGSYRAIAVIGFTGKINIGCGRYAEDEEINARRRFKRVWIVSRNNDGHIEHTFLKKHGAEWIAGGLLKILENGDRIIRARQMRGRGRGLRNIDGRDQAQDPVVNYGLRNFDNLQLQEENMDPVTMHRRTLGERPLEGLVLNLGDDHNPGTRKYHYRFGSLDHTMFTPNGGSYIFSVMDGDRELWKAENGEKCMRARIFSTDATYMLELDVESGDSTESIYFSKRNGVWED